MFCVGGRGAAAAETHAHNYLFSSPPGGTFCLPHPPASPSAHLRAQPVALRHLLQRRPQAAHVEAAQAPAALEHAAEQLAAAAHLAALVVLVEVAALLPVEVVQSDVVVAPRGGDAAVVELVRRGDARALARGRGGAARRGGGACGFFFWGGRAVLQWLVRGQWVRARAASFKFRRTARQTILLSHGKEGAVCLHRINGTHPAGRGPCGWRRRCCPPSWRCRRPTAAAASAAAWPAT